MNPTPFPNLDLPLVDPDTGKISKGWYQLLSSMYLLLGGSNPVSTPDLGVMAGLMDENFSSAIEIENTQNALRNALALDDAVLPRMAELKATLEEIRNAQAALSDATARVSELSKRVADVEVAQSFSGEPYGPVTLTASGVQAGTYQGLTVDQTGRVTAAGDMKYLSTTGALGSSLLFTANSAGICQFSIGGANYHSMQLVAGSSGSAFSFADSGFFAVTADSNADIMNGTAGGKSGVMFMVFPSRNVAVTGGAPISDPGHRFYVDGDIHCTYWIAGQYGTIYLNGENSSYPNASIACTANAAKPSIQYQLAAGGEFDVFSGAGTKLLSLANDTGALTVSSLATTQTPTASTTASDHSVPITLNGQTYYLRLSSTV